MFKVCRNTCFEFPFQFFTFIVTPIWSNGHVWGCDWPLAYFVAPGWYWLYLGPRHWSFALQRTVSVAAAFSRPGAFLVGGCGVRVCGGRGASFVAPITQRTHLLSMSLCGFLNKFG